MGGTLFVNKITNHKMDQINYLYGAAKCENAKIFNDIIKSMGSNTEQVSFLYASLHHVQTKLYSDKLDEEHKIDEIFSFVGTMIPHYVRTILRNECYEIIDIIYERRYPIVLDLLKKLYPKIIIKWILIQFYCQN